MPSRALQARVKELEKAASRGRGANGSVDVDALLASATDVGGRLAPRCRRRRSRTPRRCRTWPTASKAKLGDSAVVLGAVADGKVHLVATVAPALVERGVKAGAIVRVAAEVTGGGGGGRDTMARAGRPRPRQAARGDRRRARGDRGGPRGLMRVLALDYGSARCGCALSDPTGTLATPARSASSGRHPKKGFAALARAGAGARGRPGRGRAAAGPERARTRAQTREARAFAARLDAAARRPRRALRRALHDDASRERSGGTRRSRTPARPPCCSRIGLRDTGKRSAREPHARGARGRPPRARAPARRARGAPAAARAGQLPTCARRPMRDEFQPQQARTTIARPAEPAHDPQATQMFDVTSTWTEEHVAVAEPDAEPEPAAPRAAAGARARDPARDAPRSAPTAGRQPRPRRQAARPAARRRPRPRPRRPAAARAGSPHRRRCSRSSLVVLAGWFLWSIYQPGAGDGSGSVVVTIPRGASVEPDRRPARDQRRRSTRRSSSACARSCRAAAAT